MRYIAENWPVTFRRQLALILEKRSRKGEYFPE
jgi:hypothetical protein